MIYVEYVSPSVTFNRTSLELKRGQRGKGNKDE